MLNTTTGGRRQHRQIDKISTRSPIESNNDENTCPELNNKKNKKKIIDDEMNKLEDKYVKQLKIHRIKGELTEVEKVLEKLIHVQMEKLGIIEGGVNGKHIGGKKLSKEYEEALLNLAESYCCLGNNIRLQIGSKRTIIKTKDHGKILLGKSKDSQKNVLYLLKNRISKAEDCLFKGLEIRKEVLELSNNIMYHKKLVAHALDSLAVLQHTYGLKDADEHHLNALEFFAENKHLSYGNENWNYNIKHAEWQLSSLDNNSLKVLQQHVKKTTRRGGKRGLLGKAFGCAVKPLFYHHPPSTRTERQEKVVVLKSSSSSSTTNDKKRYNSPTVTTSSSENENTHNPHISTSNQWKMILKSQGYRQHGKPNKNVPWEIILDPNTCEQLIIVSSGGAKRNQPNPYSKVEYLVLSKSLVGGVPNKSSSKSINKRKDCYGVLEYLQDEKTWMIHDESNNNLHYNKTAIFVNRIRIQSVVLRIGDEITIAAGVGNDVKFGCSLAPNDQLTFQVSYTLEQILPKKLENLFPKHDFRQTKDEMMDLFPFGYFHALVVTEYARLSRNRERVSTPVSKMESQELYQAVKRQGIPFHFWLDFIHYRIQQKLQEQFVYYHRRKELNYLL